jgi:glycerate kinase
MIRAVARVRGIPETVLVAPDAFKGTLAAPEIAEAIGSGLLAAGVPVDLCPIADGGEGTLQVLGEALAAELHRARVQDPLGRLIEANFGLTPARRRVRAAIVESAAASGLQRVAESERDALAASTFGTGELIAAAVDAGADVVYLGVGGSATTDGGAGAIAALRAAGGLRDARLIVLCDVRVSFEQAAPVFAPQKGAGEAEVRRLAQRLNRLARRLPRDPRGVPMTGAAGGLSGGLWSAFDAELVPGAAFVLDTVEFDRRMHASRAVVTGEGKLDQQSLSGKAVSEVATRARQSGVPCHAIVGTRELDAFGARVLDLQGVLEAGTPSQLEEAGQRLAELL